RTNHHHTIGQYTSLIDTLYENATESAPILTQLNNFFMSFFSSDISTTDAKQFLIEQSLDDNVQSYDNENKNDEQSSNLSHESKDMADIIDQVNESLSLHLFEKQTEHHIPLTIQEIEALELPKADLLIGGHTENLLYTAYGMPYIVESVPRDLGLNPFTGGIEYVFLPLIPHETVSATAQVCTDLPIVCNITQEVFESGLYGDGVLGSALDPNNPNNQIANPPPTEVDGNLINGQTGVTVCEIIFDNVVYSPDQGGIITICTGAGNLVVNATTGDYSFILNAVPEPGKTEIDDVTQIFKYILCDEDNCQSSANLSIIINDDFPLANPDTTENCVTAGGSTISGNVLTNDVPGADGPIQVYEIFYDDGAKSILLNGNPVTVATEDGGTLTVNPDGSWTYTSTTDLSVVDPNEISNNEFDDSFSYTVIDAEGHVSNNGSGPDGSVAQSICVDIPPAFNCEDVTLLQPLTTEQVAQLFPEVLLGVQCVPSSPNTFEVTTTLDEVNSKDNLLSLREAIIASNNDSGSTTDIICLDSGVYTLSISPTKANGDTSGDLNITSTDHTLIIQGNGENNTFIDANAIDRIFEVNAGVTLILRDLTIENGSVKGDDGGGILNNGVLVLYNVEVLDNSVTNNGFGGGIASHGNGTGSNGDVTLINSEITDNTTERSGAGIYFVGDSTKGTLPTLTIEDSLIHDNQTVSGNSSLGGDGGGGVYIQNATANINDSTIACNSAFDGGGIEAVQKNKEATVVDITNSTIVNNIADGGKGLGSGTGGGILDDGATFQIANSTMTLNQAGKGGAIFLDHDGNVTIDNSTIANNETDIKGISGAIDTQSHGTVSLTSTIVAANDADVIYDNNLSDDRDLSGTGFTSFGNNLIGNITNGSNDFTPTSGDIINSDPMLGTIANNGGPTLTLALQTGSPAIDTGSNPLSLTTDQRGEPRPDIIGTNPDIGAYETQSSLPNMLDVLLNNISNTGTSGGTPPSELLTVPPPTETSSLDETTTKPTTHE
ncbi:MAG: hypothetical protein JSR17_07185, partial [Proteobacteria bacterium]|nr:hypothetical protein [Pseudomonadota bacterium]